jgi:hypothetical protein
MEAAWGRKRRSNLAFPKKTSKLADGLGKKTGLEICDSFREILGTQGCDFVSHESNFGDTENALRWVE